MFSPPHCSQSRYFYLGPPSESHMSAPLWGAKRRFPLPQSACHVTYSLMTGPTIREVRAPASPFVARAPLAIGCLCENGCCKLRPCCGCVLPDGTHLPQTARLHARTPFIRLFVRLDANRGGFPSRLALVTPLRYDVVNDEILMTARRRTAS